MRLARLVRRNAQAHPDSPALTDGHQVISWSGVHELGRSVRQRCGRAAIGTRVAICGDSGIMAIPLVIGLLSAGASVAILASADLGRTEMALDIWSADAVVDVDPSAEHAAFHRTVDGLTVQLRSRSGRPRSGRDAPSVVFSTSGSTGNPRLVSCPDVRMTAVSKTIAQVLGLQRSDNIVSASPLHFDYGFNQFTLAAASGASLAQGDYLNLSHLLSNGPLEATVLASGPSQLRMLTGMPESRVRNSTLRMVTSTGSAFPIELTEQMRGLWPNAEIRSMYGMTECKRVSISTHEEFLADPTSVGHPIPGVAVSVDPASSEILVRTPFLMTFESSPSSDGPRVVVRDGVQLLATGDVGRLSDDGELSRVGRLSQFTKIHDVRVSLAECEQVAVRHPAVRDAAVTVRDNQLVVWCATGSAGDDPAARESIRTELVRWTGISTLSDAVVAFLPELPRLPNGKLDRQSLAELGAS